MPVQICNFDELYLERLRSGDSQTEQHFATYFGGLLQLKLRTRLPSQSAIEDVRQETFIRVWIALRKHVIQCPEKLGAFVNSVCNNVLREHYRSRVRECRSDADATSIPDPSLGVVEIIAKRQTEQIVGLALAELPRKDHDLIRKIFFEGRDKNEVCRAFGVDRGYLRVLLHRAKGHFRSLYFKRMANPGRPKLRAGRYPRIQDALPGKCTTSTS